MIGLILLVLLVLYALGGLLTVAHFWKKYGKPHRDDFWVCIIGALVFWPWMAYFERRGL